MKGLFITEKGVLSFLECDILPFGEYDCLVKIEACGICNSTDWKIIEGRFRKGPFPMLLGHESIGSVIEVGSKVKNFTIGDVVLRPRIHDAQLSIPGSTRFGGFVQYGFVTDVWEQNHVPYQASIIHPQQKVPKEIPFTYGASLVTLKENLSVIRSLSVQKGESLAIVGTGPAAQAMVFNAKNIGISPIVIFGRRQQWADKFHSLGADCYIAGDDFPESVKNILNNGGFDKVIEAVGSRDALFRCMQLAKKHGSVHIYGVPSDDEFYDAKVLEDPRVSFLKVNEASAHEEILRWIEEGRLNLEDWVSQILPWEDYEHAFALVKEKKADKVILKIH